MEVVVIEKATFERMLSGFEIFAEKVECLCREHEDLGEKEWLDSDDVCRFAARLDFFIFFASGTLLRTPETLSGIICPPFRL